MGSFDMFRRDRDNFLRKIGCICFGIPILAICVAAAQQANSGQTTISVSEREIRIPMAEAGQAGLQGLLLTPSVPGQHPLVLLTHGSLESSSEGRDMGPGILEPEALWFAQRGWVAAVILRRGYGTSGGSSRRRPFRCGEADLETYGDDDARDLSAAFEYLTTWPEIDASTVIVVGDSTGGVAAVSFGVHAPPGLKAVVSFSGYWPAMLLKPWACKSHTASTFGNLKADHGVPMLWIGSAHDRLIGRKTAVKVYDAFTAAGGNAALSMVEQSGDGGHFLFTYDPKLWSPIVERFLAQQHLPFKRLFPDLPVPNLHLPANFSIEAQAALQRFLRLGPYKAFAVSEEGSWAYVSGKQTPRLAESEALLSCGAGCRIFAGDTQTVTAAASTANPDSQ